MKSKDVLIEKSLSFSKLTDREFALQMALTKGLSPDQLIQLGNLEPPSPDREERRFLGWALVATGTLVGGGVAAQFISPVPTSEVIRSTFDLIFTPGNAPVVEATWRAIAHQFAQWGVYFGESSVLISFLLNGIRSRLMKSDQVQRVNLLHTALQSAIERGEAPIPMQKGFIAIDLGSGDAIGRAIGEKIGWGSAALPLIEGEKNTSGFNLWDKLPNPSTGITKEDFFKALDRINFKEAGAFILCPVAETQTFLPDSRNPSHFDLRFDEIVDRINLLDEYCRLRGVDRKKIIIISDKGLQRSVGPYVEEKKKPKPVTYTLQNYVDTQNKDRQNKITVADPTDIALGKLNSPEYNPNGLPLEFFEDPYATEIYGPRFAQRCRDTKIKVKTNGDPKEKSLSVGYGLDDVATRQTIAMLPPESVAIIIDQARAVATPYRSLILSEVVRDWVIERL